MDKKALEENEKHNKFKNIDTSDEESDIESDDIRLILFPADVPPRRQDKTIGMPITTSPKRIASDGRPYREPSYVSDNEDSFRSAEFAPSEGTDREEVPSINKNALPAHANTYRLEKFERNAMIIFNHEKVEGYEDREGTLKDEEALRDTFSRFGFVVHETGRNLKKVDIFSALKEFSEQNFTDCGCVVIVILTHGSSNGLLLATDEGQRYSERDIISYFKTQSKVTLITKPIILIIQACRGEASAQGVEVRNIAFRSLIIPKDIKEEFKAYYLPVESDMLVFHSSYPGKPSFRPDQGSWFIQTLCKLVKQLYLTHDLESIFIEVKRKVAIDKYTTEHNPVTGENDVHKQMPVVTSTLIRKLYLRRYNDRPPVLPSIAVFQQCAETLTDSELQNERPIYCDCYMEHFNYMKACLRNIVKNYPQDETAKCLLSIAENESGINEEDVKNKLTVINNHIRNNYRDTEFHKFIHFFKSDCNFSHTEIGPIKSTLQMLNRRSFVFMFMASVCAYVVYRCRRPIVELAQ